MKTFFKWVGALVAIFIGIQAILFIVSAVSGGGGDDSASNASQSAADGRVRRWCENKRADMKGVVIPEQSKSWSRVDGESCFITWEQWDGDRRLPDRTVEFHYR